MNALHSNPPPPTPNMTQLFYSDIVVRAKCSTLCIHVAEGAKLGQNGLKMGTIHLFVPPRLSRIIFGKMRF